MISNNSFFNSGDPNATSIGNPPYPLHPEWWSRIYEYQWALSFAEPGMVVADMGCGWMPRPLKNVLAQTCKTVYAVDRDPRLLEQPRAGNINFVVGDITADLPDFPYGCMDRVFCVSVLEDLDRMVGPALKNFARMLKPGGLIIATFDVQYDLARECKPYPGVNLKNFMGYMYGAGLEFVGPFMPSKANAVSHPDWNLCCFHCVLGLVN